jgi:hypothetical protein
MRMAGILSRTHSVTVVLYAFAGALLVSVECIPVCYSAFERRTVLLIPCGYYRQAGSDIKRLPAFVLLCYISLVTIGSCPEHFERIHFQILVIPMEIETSLTPKFDLADAEWRRCSCAIISYFL